VEIVPEPPFGEEPQDPPRPPRPPKEDEERRQRIERLEAEIRELEGALKREDIPVERRDEVKKRLSEKQAQMKELRAGEPWWGREPKGDLQEKTRRLEGRIRDLEKALLSKELGPEDRKEMTNQLHHAHAQMDELRAQMKQEPFGRGPGMFGGPPMDPESQKLHMEAQELDRASMDLSAKLRMVEGRGTTGRPPWSS
jgi:DNA repair exonuclease SbcCD ATPase subunit